MFNWLREFYADPEFKRRREFLRSVALFRWVPRREFGRLLRALVMRHYRAGDALFEEGENGRALFILVSGEVEITRLGKDGKPRSIATLKQGDCFGEIALIDQMPRFSTARATSSVQAYLLHKTELDRLVDDSPRVALAILGHAVAVIGDHLRELTGKIAAREE